MISCFLKDKTSQKKKKTIRGKESEEWGWGLAIEAIPRNKKWMEKWNTKDKIQNKKLRKTRKYQQQKKSRKLFMAWARNKKIEYWCLTD